MPHVNWMTSTTPQQQQKQTKHTQNSWHVLWANIKYWLENGIISVIQSVPCYQNNPARDIERWKEKRQE